MEVIKYILAIYSWGVIEVLIFFLWRIARFYEEASGQRVGSHFLLLPAVLLAVGVVWYLMYNNDFTGQPVGDLLLFSGGILLLPFSIRLQQIMTGER